MRVAIAVARTCLSATVCWALVRAGSAFSSAQQWWDIASTQAVVLRYRLGQNAVVHLFHQTLSLMGQAVVEAWHHSTFPTKLLLVGVHIFLLACGPGVPTTCWAVAAYVVPTAWQLLPTILFSLVTWIVTRDLIFMVTSLSSTTPSQSSTLVQGSQAEHQAVAQQSVPSHPLLSSPCISSSGDAYEEHQLGLPFTHSYLSEGIAISPLQDRADKGSPRHYVANPLAWYSPPGKDVKTMCHEWWDETPMAAQMRQLTQQLRRTAQEAKTSLSPQLVPPPAEVKTESSPFYVPVSTPMDLPRSLEPLAKSSQEAAMPSVFPLSPLPAHLTTGPLQTPTPSSAPVYEPSSGFMSAGLSSQVESSAPSQVTTSRAAQIQHLKELLRIKAQGPSGDMKGTAVQSPKAQPAWSGQVRTVSNTSESSGSSMQTASQMWAADTPQTSTAAWIQLQKRMDSLLHPKAQAALEFFEGQAMQAGATADDKPLMDMHIPQLLSSAEDARMRARFAEMTGQEKQGGWECTPAHYTPAVRLVSQCPQTADLAKLGQGQGGAVY
ncbi:hypothetical protein ABBQ38_011038 [Trebouxia sp. C0009 RCD-2024]